MDRAQAANGVDGGPPTAEKVSSEDTSAKPEGQFASADEAAKYVSRQRRDASINLPHAIPFQLPDGSFTVVTEGSPQYAAAVAQQQPDLAASPTGVPVTPPAAPLPPVSANGGKEPTKATKATKPAEKRVEIPETAAPQGESFAPGQKISGIAVHGAAIAGTFDGMTSAGKVRLRQGSNVHFVDRASVHSLEAAAPAAPAPREAPAAAPRAPAASKDPAAMWATGSEDTRNAMLGAVGLGGKLASTFNKLPFDQLSPNARAGMYAKAGMPQPKAAAKPPTPQVPAKEFSEQDRAERDRKEREQRAEFNRKSDEAHAANREAVKAFKVGDILRRKDDGYVFGRITDIDEALGRVTVAHTSIPAANHVEVAPPGTPIPREEDQKSIDAGKFIGDEPGPKQHRFIIRTPRGVVQVNLDEDGIGLRGTNAELHGDSISGTGYRSITSLPPIEEWKDNPQRLATKLVEDAQDEAEKEALTQSRKRKPKPEGERTVLPKKSTLKERADAVKAKNREIKDEMARMEAEKKAAEAKGERYVDPVHLDPGDPVRDKASGATGTIVRKIDERTRMVKWDKGGENAWPLSQLDANERTAPTSRSDPHGLEKQSETNAEWTGRAYARAGMSSEAPPEMGEAAAADFRKGYAAEEARLKAIIHAEFDAEQAARAANPATARADYWAHMDPKARRAAAQNAGVKDGEIKALVARGWHEMSANEQKKLAVVIDSFLKVATVTSPFQAGIDLWARTNPAERTDLMRSIGYTDADQLRAFANSDWEALGTTARANVDAFAKHGQAMQAPVPMRSLKERAKKVAERSKGASGARPLDAITEDIAKIERTALQEAEAVLRPDVPKSYVSPNHWARNSADAALRLQSLTIQQMQSRKGQLEKLAREFANANKDGKRKLSENVEAVINPPDAFPIRADLKPGGSNYVSVESQQEPATLPVQNRPLAAMDKEQAKLRADLAKVQDETVRKALTERIAAIDDERAMALTGKPAPVESQQEPAPTSDYKAPAIAAVSEFVAGKIDKAALIAKLAPLGMTEAQVGSVTYRLQDDFSAADIRAVVAGASTTPAKVSTHGFVEMQSHSEAIRLANELTKSTGREHVTFSGALADPPVAGWIVVDTIDAHYDAMLARAKASHAEMMAGMTQRTQPPEKTGPSFKEQQDNDRAVGRSTLTRLAEQAQEAGADRLAQRLRYLADDVRKKNPMQGQTVTPAHAKQIAAKFPALLERAKADPADEFRDVDAYGVGKRASKNTIFTDEAAEKARAVLRDKLGINKGKRGQAGGLDPDVLQAGITLAGYHIEKGARKFAAFAKAMLDDLGDGIKPYLKSFYMAAKYDPNVADFAKEMSNEAEMDAVNLDDAMDAEVVPAAKVLAQAADVIEIRGEPGAPHPMPWKLAPEQVLPAPAKTIRAAATAGPVLPLAEAQARVESWKAEARRIGKTGVNANKVVFSLFDRTGQWSQPYVDAGYDVRRYDIQNGDDLMAFMPIADIVEAHTSGKEVAGVLAAPPCTSFSSSGARWWAERHDKPNEAWLEKTYGAWASKYFDTPLDYANTLVAVTQAVIEFAAPTQFHVVENPVGRIAEQNDLPKPLLTFDPNHFGDPYTKKTLLWGSFNPNLPTAHVEATDGSAIANLSSSATNERSETPEGFAYAFFMANHGEAVAQQGESSTLDTGETLAQTDDAQGGTQDDSPPEGHAAPVNQQLDETLRPDEPVRGAKPRRARRADDRAVRPAGERNPVADDGQQGLGFASSDGAVQDGPHGGVADDRGGISARDFRPDVGGLTREGSWRTTAERNVDAIELALKIQAEGRPATLEEQTQLSKYVGFGAGEIRNQLFPVIPSYIKVNDPTRLIWPDQVRDSWKPLAERMAALPVEWQKSVLQSTQYAHYTSEGIIRSTWSGDAAHGLHRRQGARARHGHRQLRHADAAWRASRPASTPASSSTARRRSSPPCCRRSRTCCTPTSSSSACRATTSTWRSATRRSRGEGAGRPGLREARLHAARLLLRQVARPGAPRRPARLRDQPRHDGQADGQGAALHGRPRRPPRRRAAAADRLRGQRRHQGRHRRPVPAQAQARRGARRPAVQERRDDRHPGRPGRGERVFRHAHPEMVLGQQRLSGNQDDQNRRINGLRNDNEYTVVSYDSTPAQLDEKFAAAIENLPQNVYSSLSADERQVRQETAKIDFDPREARGRRLRRQGRHAHARAGRRRPRDGRRRAPAPPRTRRGSRATWACATSSTRRAWRKCKTATGRPR
jgi:hypothetical protein